MSSPEDPLEHKSQSSSGRETGLVEVIRLPLNPVIPKLERVFDHKEESVSRSACPAELLAEDDVPNLNPEMIRDDAHERRYAGRLGNRVRSRPRKDGEEEWVVGLDPRLYQLSACLEVRRTGVAHVGPPGKVVFAADVLEEGLVVCWGQGDERGVAAVERGAGRCLRRRRGGRWADRGFHGSGVGRKGGGVENF